jgi:predicted Ser/Thr protein kinase
VNESPLGLFAPEQYAAALEKEYGIAPRYLTGIMSPWAIKRLKEFDGDISQFRVVRVQPSVLRQVAIAKTEPGDEKTRTSSLVSGRRSQARPLRRTIDAYIQRAVPRACSVRRDVQGADQDAAPVVDRDPGRQLQRH